MGKCRCKRCGNILILGEDHACFIHKKFDYRYSIQQRAESDENMDEGNDKSTESSNDNSQNLSRAFGRNQSKRSELISLCLFQNNERDKSTKFAGNSNFAQLRNLSDSSYFRPISDFQAIQVQTNQNASSTASSENAESNNRHENVFFETYNREQAAAGSSGIDIQNLRGSGVSDQLHAKPDEECKIWKLMARYLCQLCDNVVTYGENHPCFFYKNDDNVYSLPEYWKGSSRHLSQADQQNKKENPELKNLSLFQNNAEVKSLFSKGNWFRTFAESTDNAQTRNPYENSYFNLISDVEVIEVEGNKNAFVTVSSENVESDYRPETDQRETFKKTITIIGPSDVDLQTQRLLDVSDLMHATAEEECKMPVEENKWQTLNNDKNNFIYSLECGMNKIISDGNKVSETANLIVNLDLPSGNKESKNGKQVSECVNHEHISPEVHSQVQSKKTKVATYVKEPHSTIKDDNAVAGPSGICHRKKKFPKTCSRKDNLKPNYQTRTGDEPFMCNIFFYHSELYSCEFKPNIEV
ncbi:hypothetical protein HNY73_009734 [Argiope bruennichi]|uniref:Uncharacterized protein n=1 Tax=Argiope bruennichi TaxID=94029 RepID=A0A8T0FH56_ARGBR|nr:hypothetical protein HNY73_009734 [Argiope bruennichi]